MGAAWLLKCFATLLLAVVMYSLIALGTGFLLLLYLDWLFHQ